MQQAAVAYLANSTLVVAPIIQTTAGLGLEVEPIVVEPHEPSIIAAALSSAISRSGRTVPHPSQDEWKGLFKPFLDAVGVRSSRAFMKDAIRVEIRVAGDRLELTPQRNLGSNRGFEPLTDLAVSAPQGDYPAAAAAILSMFGG
ncbi:hypothetical protein [Tsuneonella dongtanensis]|uniref:hypothetical protein n=1 Tax=Tsuneonella dongtanensis TaxID=692370 RepID=UPI0012EEA393|nr:hypothetical protein [Tsuneonella dongtanensis]